MSVVSLPQSTESDGFIPFPLLRLPLINLKDVLLEMGPIERTIFSMCSDKTKNSTRMLRILKDRYLFIEAYDSLQCEFPIKKNQYCSCSFKNGEATLKIGRHKEIEFAAPGFDERSWLNHFLYIMNPSEVANLCFQYHNREFDESQLQIVKECLKGHKIGFLHIELTTQTQNIVDIMKAFPAVEDVNFGTDQYQQLNSTEQLTLRQILPWKFGDLSITANIPLNDLLLLDCVSLDIWSCELSEKDMNVFMRHWVGGLIPQLEHFHIVTNKSPFSHRNVLEGIPYQLGPVRRKIKLYQMPTQFGGIDIQTAGGAKATLVFWPACGQLTGTLHNSEFISFK